MSTAIGASGMAFPNYIKTLEFANKNIDLENVYLVFVVIANDFDGSYKKHNENNKGMFFFDENGFDYEFEPLISS